MSTLSAKMILAFAVLAMTALAFGRFPAMTGQDSADLAQFGGKVMLAAPRVAVPDLAIDVAMGEADATQSQATQTQ